jgi:hypothetical protein
VKDCLFILRSGDCAVNGAGEHNLARQNKFFMCAKTRARRNEKSEMPPQKNLEMLM